VNQLPSVGTDPASLGDLSADASYVRRTLDAIDEPVVLVGHSYSGMVITEIADHPNVRHTVYLTAFWPERGKSALNLLGDVLPLVFVQRTDGAIEVTSEFEVAWKAFCPDLERDRAHRCSRALCCSPIRQPPLRARQPIGHIRQRTYCHSRD
jgi:pimeloyl-ACP methyl ester carboxylesterase